MATQKLAGPALLLCLLLVPSGRPHKGVPLKTKDCDRVLQVRRELALALLAHLIISLVGLIQGTPA